MNARKILLIIFLLFTAFCTGAGIMIVELVGVRVLAPCFGLSLYVWTSLIAVAMISLAIGYHLGGFIIDKFPQIIVPYIFISLAGVWTALIPIFQKPILEIGANWGNKWGPMGSSLILFTLPLVFLAMVYPSIIKLITSRLEKIGSIVGSISAVSTLGSILGTIMTGFFLIPLLPISKILLFTGLVLIFISIVGYLITSRLMPAVSFLLIGIFSFFFVTQYKKSTKIGDIDILYEESSSYLEIKVLYDRNFFGEPSRILVTNSTIQGLKPDSGRMEQQLIFADLFYLLPCLRPEARDVLMIGLGAGVVWRALKQFKKDENPYGIEYNLDCVDIDEKIAYVAKNFFNVTEDENNRIYVMDGREFLKKCTKRYDVVIFDALSGGTAPTHLMTRESISDMKRVLKPGGLLIYDYIGFLTDEALLAPPEESTNIIKKLFNNVTHHLKLGGATALRSVYKTIKEVFPENMAIFIGYADIYGSIDPSFKLGPKDLVNYLFFASDERIEDPNSPGGFKIQPNKIVPFHVLQKLRYPLEKMRFKTFPDEGGFLLTDDYNPCDLYQIHQNRVIRNRTFGRYKSVLLR
jgi:spermidine synthase